MKIESSLEIRLLWQIELESNDLNFKRKQYEDTFLAKDKYILTRRSRNINIEHFDLRSKSHLCTFKSTSASCRLKFQGERTQMHIEHKKRNVFLNIIHSLKM